VTHANLECLRQVLCRILLPCPRSNFAQNVFISSVRRSEAHIPRMNKTTETNKKKINEKTLDTWLAETSAVVPKNS